MTNDHKFILDRINVDPTTGCWLWNRFINRDGYGHLGQNSITRRYHRTVLAHRLAYLIFVGPIPDGLILRHKHGCTGPHCCNPDHVEPGTHQQNSDDKKRDQTDAKSLGYGFQIGDNRGDSNNTSKLTEEQVLEIRQLRSEMKLKYRELAEMFHVSIATIGYVVKNQVWSHV